MVDKKIFLGKWKIIEMELWDQDFIDAEVPGYISFGENGRGEFQFGYVHGYMDCYYLEKNECNAVEFSWEGNDEMDSAFGRGSATVVEGKLLGHLFFHDGDDSEFEAVLEPS